jgi:WD40 repeat protein
VDDLRWQKLCKRFPYRPANFRIEHVLQRAEPGRPLQSGGRPVTALAFSPDAASIAASGGGLIPGAVDIRVFDVASRELRKICHFHRMGVFDLAFDPDTALLASASHDYSVVLWELARDDAIFLVGGPSLGISRAAARFVGTRVIVADGMAFAGEHAALTTFDMATGDIRTLFELEGDFGISKLVILRQDGLLIAAIDNQHFPGRPQIRCVTIDGTEQAHYQLETYLYDLGAADARTLVATGSLGYCGPTEVFVLDAASGQSKARRTLGPEIGAHVANSPARDRFAVAYHHGVEVCRLESLEPELQLRLGDERACSVAWSPDGASIAVGTLERTVRLFNAATGKEHLG